MPHGRGVVVFVVPLCRFRRANRISRRPLFLELPLLLGIDVRMIPLQPQILPLGSAGLVFDAGILSNEARRDDAAHIRIERRHGEDSPEFRRQADTQTSVRRQRGGRVALMLMGGHRRR